VLHNAFKKALWPTRGVVNVAFCEPPESWGKFIESIGGRLIDDHHFEFPNKCRADGPAPDNLGKSIDRGPADPGHTEAGR
jgi:hypothetical protein